MAFTVSITKPHVIAFIQERELDVERFIETFASAWDVMGHRHLTDDGVIMKLEAAMAKRDSYLETLIHGVAAQQVEVSCSRIVEGEREKVGPAIQGIEAIQKHLNLIYHQNPNTKGQYGMDCIRESLEGHDFFLDADIEDTSRMQVKGKGDMHVHMPGRPSILLEVKAGREKIRWDQVKRFEDDVRASNMHGIMISNFPGAGVVRRDLFHIEPCGSVFALFLTNVNSDAHLLAMAFKILYMLDQHVSQATASTSLAAQDVAGVCDKLQAILKKVRDATRHTEQARKSSEAACKALRDLALDDVLRELETMHASISEGSSADVSTVEKVPEGGKICPANELCHNGKPYASIYVFADHMCTKHPDWAQKMRYDNTAVGNQINKELEKLAKDKEIKKEKRVIKL